MDNFGMLLSQMLQFLRERRDERMQDAVSYVSSQVKASTSAINKWREGSLKPNFTAIETLLRIGLTEANMDQQWAEAFLRESNHPQAPALLERYRLPTQTVHELPRKLYINYVGRDDRKREILGLLRAVSARDIIPLVGFEGAGKSALALDIAWECIENPTISPEDRFDHIVWTSAEKTRLLPDGTEDTFDRATSAADIYTAIARALGNFDLNFTPPSPEKNRELLRLLRQKQRVLLILDDIDKMAETEIRQITVFLQNLPLTTKAIVTSQWNHGWQNPIVLQPLTNRYMLDLIRDESAERHVSLTPEQQQRIADLAEGIPLVAWLAIGKLAMGFGFRTVEEELENGHDELLRFLFEDRFKILHERQRDAFHVLLALSFFDYSSGASLGALASICSLAKEDLPPLLEWLDSQHLAEYRIAKHEQPRLHRMAQKYVRIFEDASTPLSGQDVTSAVKVEETTVPEWILRERQWLYQARLRWIHWYLSYMEKFNGDIPRNWHAHYVNIDKEWANLVKVFSWCMDSPGCEQYIVDFWVEAHDGLLRYSDICGHWQEREKILSWLRRTDQYRRNAQAPSLLTDFERAKVLSSLAMTALLRFRRREASSVRVWLDEAFQLVGEPHEARDFDLRCRLWEERAFLASRLHDAPHKEVVDILKEARKEWWGLSDITRERREAEYFYRLGTIHFIYGEYDEAEMAFNDALTMYKNRQRTELACYCWLAEIALKRGQIEAVRDYLDRGYEAAKENGELRRIATYQRLYAWYNWKTGNVQLARKEAQEAYMLFRNLGMIEEKNLTWALIEEIDPSAIRDIGDPIDAKDDVAL